MRVRWVALTGTPGVGKTSVARALRGLGFDVLDGNRLARANGCVVGLDRGRRSQIVDPGRVARVLRRMPPADAPRILEAHWSHAVPGMDAAIVLRLHPTHLSRRLARRRWRKEKIRENVQAEALDVILQECVQNFGKRRVGEIDTTGEKIAYVTSKIARVLEAPERRLINLEIGRIDWSQELLRWS